ncbi:hypothetical protein LTR53_001311 [Teratosphaeriaceae sp. CCFEE 6253]|nr:hypothetical protein LTR53_001311 [Teratosphaeriaceae sp. CCFEE 6253]
MRLISFAVFLSLWAGFAGPAYARATNEKRIPATPAGYQVSSSHSGSAASVTTVAGSGNSSALIIPNLASSACVHPGSPVDGQSPCIAFCGANDTACMAAASAEVRTCSPLWTDYLATAEGRRPLGSEWSTTTTTVVDTGVHYTTTVDEWTMFSTASASFLVGNPTERGKVTTMTPVYALGSPTQRTSLVSYPDNNYTFTMTIGPTLHCKFTAISTAFTRTDCGQCTMTGGTVELLYWPTRAAAASGPVSSAGVSLVHDGITLYSPSAYISFQTAYAANSCSRIGRNHTGTMLAIRPADFSTLVHWGGKVAQSGANQYGSLDYADLTGLPPASVYEAQPSCQMFGCATILPSGWNPTLVVPEQMRSLDTAWADCAIGLEGLYDPPVALIPRAVVATPTAPYDISTAPISATPRTTATLYAPETSALSPSPDPATQTQPGPGQGGTMSPVIAGSEALSQTAQTTIAGGDPASTIVGLQPSATAFSLSTPSSDPGARDETTGSAMAIPSDSETPALSSPVRSEAVSSPSMPADQASTASLQPVVVLPGAVSPVTTPPFTSTIPKYGTTEAPSPTGSTGLAEAAATPNALSILSAALDPASEVPPAIASATSVEAPSAPVSGGPSQSVTGDAPSLASLNSADPAVPSTTAIVPTGADFAETVSTAASTTPVASVAIPAGDGSVKSGASPVSGRTTMATSVGSFLQSDTPPSEAATGVVARTSRTFGLSSDDPAVAATPSRSGPGGTYLPELSSAGAGDMPGVVTAKASSDGRSATATTSLRLPAVVTTVAINPPLPGGTSISSGGSAGSGTPESGSASLARRSATGVLLFVSVACLVGCYWQ